jgi:hypothetical protein
VVAKVGLEPTSPCGRQILSLLRMPIPPLGHVLNCSGSHNVVVMRKEDRIKPSVVRPPKRYVLLLCCDMLVLVIAFPASFALRGHSNGNQKTEYGDDVKKLHFINLPFVSKV